MQYRKLVILLSLFIGASVLSKVMTPTSYIAKTAEVDMEKSIPLAFGDWKAIDSQSLQVVNPKEDGLESKIYNNVFEKTYINSVNQMVMLSIAYGSEQRDDMLVHFPDVCYPAQGFNIDAAETRFFNFKGAQIPVKFLNTQKGIRKEDVSYWVRVGDKLVVSRKDQKWESIKYGIQGIIADGLIFRVSTISEASAFELQKAFLRDLLSALDEKTVQFMLGENAPNGI